jgi:hypothetical protein
MIRNPLSLLLACPATPSVPLGRMSTPTILFSLSALKQTQSPLHTALAQHYAIRNQGGNLAGEKNNRSPATRDYHR